MKARVAVVGLGKMGLLHSSILSALDTVDLVALCEKSTLVRRFGKRIIPSVPIVADLGELSDMQLDAVYVTTPEASHFPIVKAVFETEIARNVFVEKPLASNHDEAGELCELANGRGGVNMVGYNRRFSVTFKKAKEVLDGGTLGQLLSFEGYSYSADFAGAGPPSGNSTRGGVLSDLGCHVVDLALWMFGELGVTGSSLESLLGGEAEDAAELRLSAPGHAGLEGALRSSWCMEQYRLPEIGLLVTGANGTLRVDEDKVETKLDGGDRAVWYRHDLGDDVSFFIGGSEYLREDDFFIRSVLDGSSPEPGFETASRVERILDDARRLDREARAG
jgi:predicted dehydrogenase